jgi:predicted short-subunit dehydrogenase-like oxidoreductase (DUF2520 family)
MAQLTLNLIGAGRVGRTLARLWHSHGLLQVQDVLTQSQASAQAAVRFIGAGLAVPTLGAMRAADLWLIATPDGQIRAVAEALAASGHAASSVFHGSGALPAAELQVLAQRGWRTASAHSLLSFANPSTALIQFDGTVCALEGNEHVVRQLQPLYQAIGGRCFALAAHEKLVYHAAAVWATNFLPVMQAQAEALWQQSGLPAELIPELRQRLLRNAVDNVLAQGPAGALTGPAARGDTELVERQRDALTALHQDTGAAYAALSVLAQRLARNGNL